METKRPFFTRFLENQISSDGMGSMSGGATHKYPSDSDDEVTHKYPSDQDEDLYLK